MHTQYLTFILRLRLDDEQSRESDEHTVVGSVQRVGLEQIHYFDSLEKLQEALKSLSAWASPPHADRSFANPKEKK